MKNEWYIAEKSDQINVAHLVCTVGPNFIMAKELLNKGPAFDEHNDALAERIVLDHNVLAGTNPAQELAMVRAVHALAAEWAKKKAPAGCTAEAGCYFTGRRECLEELQAVLANA